MPQEFPIRENFSTGNLIKRKQLYILAVGLSAYKENNNAA